MKYFFPSLDAFNLVTYITPQSIGLLNVFVFNAFCRTGMAGVPGTASAIFSAVKDVGANVIMISQVHSVSCASFNIEIYEIAVVINCFYAG